MNHTFSVFVRIASARRFLQISKTYVFLKNNMGQSMKNTQFADCADRIDVMTNFAVIISLYYILSTRREILIFRVECP